MELSYVYVTQYNRLHKIGKIGKQLGYGQFRNHTAEKSPSAANCSGVMV